MGMGLFGKSGLQGLPTWVALPLRDIMIQLRFSQWGYWGPPINNMGLCNSLVWYVPSLRYTRGLGWRMHCGAEGTESSTNKQHHLSAGPGRTPGQCLETIRAGDDLGNSAVPVWVGRLDGLAMDSGRGTTGGGSGYSPGPFGVLGTLEEFCKGLGSVTVTLKNKHNTHRPRHLKEFFFFQLNPQHTGTHPDNIYYYTSNCTRTTCTTTRTLTSFPLKLIPRRRTASDYSSL
jgi:hypothetical protein